MLPALETPAENPAGRGAGTGSRSRISQAILDCLATTDVGSMVTKPAEEDARNEAPDWELREQNEREGE